VTDLERLRDESRALRERLTALERAIGPFPPGHFHSPIPDRAELERDAARLFEGTARALPGVERNEAQQWRRFDAIRALAGSEQFPEHAQPSARYHWSNGVFGYGDAFVYHALLRIERPARVIEVGCGYSTAVLLDTCERHPEVAPRITCIDPDPARLERLLRPADWRRVEFLRARVQDVPLALFAELGAGDVLFLDTSHVAKTGSDVVHEVFEVLPRLRSGVLVHVHDIPVDFEYSREWALAGWAWNEAYLVRAFLMFNSAFEIDFHGAYLAERDPARCAAALPNCAASPGLSLWLRRR
jgi:SAM-dependent methyltransferase